MAAASQAEQQMQQKIDDVNGDTQRVLCRCCTCNQEVEEEAALLVRDHKGKQQKNLWRCRLCHNAIGRVRTALKSLSEEKNLGFKNLTQEERRDFYKTAQTQCGAHLQKLLTESINTSTIKKVSDLAQEDGNFLPLEEVEEEWKNKRPHMLAQLMLHAPRMTCKYTGIELIMVPSYSYKHSRETCDSTMDMRKLQSEQCVKKIKVATESDTQEKKKKPSDPNHNKADILKPITDAQRKRLNKCLSCLEQNKLKHADLCLHIETNNAHDSISQKLMKRITELSGKLDSLIESTKVALSKGSISSNCLKDLSEAYKETSPPLLELLNNARASVDLFSAEDSAAATD